jgi:hypothetical protein
MAAKKAKKGQAPSRTSADKLVIDFIQANKIVLIIDEVSVLNTDVKDAVYVTIKRPRVRAFYLDEIKDKEKKPNGDSGPPKIDIVN